MISYYRAVKPATKRPWIIFSVRDKGILLIFCVHLPIVYVTVFRATKPDCIPLVSVHLQQKGPHNKNTLVSTSTSLFGGGEGGAQCSKLLFVNYQSK